MRETWFINLWMIKSAKAFKISNQHACECDIELSSFFDQCLLPKSWLEQLAVNPVTYGRLSKGIQMTLLREWASHWWWKTTNHVYLTKMDWSTPSLLDYPIECLEITERIVERLGNKAEQNTTYQEVVYDRKQLVSKLGWRATVRISIQYPMHEANCDHTINGSES